jgi:hypothetical protein
MLSICTSSRCIGTAAPGFASKTRTAGEEAEEKEEGACKCSCSSSSFEPPPRSNSKLGGVSISALTLPAGNKEEEEREGGGGAGKKREEKEGKAEQKKDVKAAGARGWFAWGYYRSASAPAAKGENAAVGKAAVEAKVEYSYLIYYRHYLIYYI